MVNQIIQTSNFEEISFYPLDITEPPKIFIEIDKDSNFRIAQIMKYNEYLSSEISKRTGIVSSFKKFDYVCFILEILFVLIDVGIGTIGIFYPALNTSTSAACILITAVGTFLRGVVKKYMKRMEKHQSLLVLAKTILSQAQEKYNIAISNGDIDHEEYLTITDEFKKYETLRQNIIGNVL